MSAQEFNQLSYKNWLYLISTNAGAVYQAANLGKGFKVKKFLVKDANVYPIQVCKSYSKDV